MIKRNKTKTYMFMYLKDRSITCTKFFLLLMSHTCSYKNLMVTVFF